jgi:hypothetical protein
MVTFVAGTLTASISRDVVRPADPYISHSFLLPMFPIVMVVGESEQE